jgi:fucose 4-O-acetylase-like acetyltransferase
MRITSFDALKGVLIILVIVGHLLLGPIDQSPVRKFIYFFHMPLFVAVTGYFIKSELLMHATPFILKKYFKRLLTPYIIAFLVYNSMTWFNAYRTGGLILQTIVDTIMNPYYHLWYIPAVIMFVLYTKCLVTMPGKVSFVIGTISAFLITVLTGIYGDAINEMGWAHFFGDSRYYYYYYYFLIGYIMSRYGLGQRVSINAMNWTLIFFLLFFANQFDFLRSFCYVLINSAIIILAISLCEKKRSANNKFLAVIGKVSLPLYLWHVLPIVLFKRIYTNGGLEYYIYSGISICMLIIALVGFENKSFYLNRFLYGIPFGVKEAN